MATKKVRKAAQMGTISSNKYDIENAVLKSFMRVLKDRELFPMYLRQVKIDGVVGYILRRGHRISSDNPFAIATKTQDIVARLYDISDKMYKGRCDDIKTADKYDHVTMAINHLLHFFLEGKAKSISMDDLVSIGEEIYARSCNSLFGDSIDDLEAQRIEDETRRKQNEANKIAEMERMLHGKKGRRSDDNLGWGDGIALGNVPDGGMNGNMFMDGLRHNEEDRRLNPLWFDDDGEADGLWDGEIWV